MRLYDSMSRSLQDFEPLDPERILMYVCGPTVYDSPHLGHARAAVVFDVLFRELRHRYGPETVTYLRNYTDIDDKIIARAQAESVDIDTITARYISEYEVAMQALRCLPPTKSPRVTEVMPEIIAYIERLIAAGHGYEAEGCVFFDIASFPEYGKLSNRSADDLATVHRVEADPRKRNPLDFALWKEVKAGEPAWESPWGPGRPGWHIECSVMATEFGRETLDIHGGGQDLLFPHHENEIAQCESLLGVPFARTWMHNGFVRVNAEKMSKSLRNFITVGELLDQWPAETLRYLLLSAHYRTPLDFDAGSLVEATKAVLRLSEGFAPLEHPEDRALQPSPKQTRALESLQTHLVGALEQFDRALAQDLNTAQALGYVFDAVRESNRVLRPFARTWPAGSAPTREALAALAEACEQRLGLALKRRIGIVEAWNERALARLGLDADWIESKLAARSQARAARDFGQADAIRDELVAAGLQLEDSADESRWIVDPDALLEHAG